MPSRTKVAPPTKRREKGLADLHIHTSLGDGMADLEQILDYVQAATPLDVIAITDHDDIIGGLRAQELAAKKGYRFQVVAGMEITTLEGHLLALFMKEPVEGFQPLNLTLQQAHAQGGLCIIPHPMSWLTYSIGQTAIERILQSTEQGVYFDGIEVVNGSIAGRVTQDKTLRLNKTRYRLAETGSSDAHFLASIGKSYTIFNGKSAEDLRKCLEAKKTRADGAQVELGKIGLRQIVAQQFKSFVIAPGRTIRKPFQRFLKGLWA